MPEYELTYFDARGLAEPIRLLLSYVGADWRDNRMSGAGPGASVPDDIKSRKFYTDFPYNSMVFSKLTSAWHFPLSCLFGQVPLLEFGGNRLNQTSAILRYLGRKYNLGGKDDLDSARVDEIGDAGVDFFMGKEHYFRWFL